MEQDSCFQGPCGLTGKTTGEHILLVHGGRCFDQSLRCCENTEESLWEHRGIFVSPNNHRLFTSWFYMFVTVWAAISWASLFSLSRLTLAELAAVWLVSDSGFTRNINTGGKWEEGYDRGILPCFSFRSTLDHTSNFPPAPIMPALELSWRRVVLR